MSYKCRNKRKWRKAKTARSSYKQLNHAVYYLVRAMGLEPTRHKTHAPQTCLSADSSTLAFSKQYYSIFCR